MRDSFANDFSNNQNLNLTPAQRRRLGQLYQQYRGVNAFAGDQTQNGLQFSTQQQQKLQLLQQRYNQQLSQLANTAAQSDELQQRLNRLQQETMQNFNRMLTPAQQQQFRDMQGDSFDFSSRSYFGDRNPPTQSPGNPSAGNSGAISPGNPSSGNGPGTQPSASPQQQP